MRKETVVCRRKYTRALRRGQDDGIQEARDEYKKSKKSLNLLIGNSKKKCWMVDGVPIITVMELNEAADKLKLKKAPGRDGIPAEAVKVLVKTLPEKVLSVLNLLIRECRLPNFWKHQVGPHT